jgi:hypothetical protein
MDFIIIKYKILFFTTNHIISKVEEKKISIINKFEKKNTKLKIVLFMII